MIRRAVYRWAIAAALAAIGLIGIMLGLHTAPIVLARPTSVIINCGGPIQACINSASNGDTIVVAAGNYTESLTLNKPVSLTGVGAPSVTIKAFSNQRVLTVTGSAISNSVIISGLTLIGGNLSGSSCPNSCGGGMLITNNASPIIQNSTIQNNAAYKGGGMRVEAGSIVTLMNVSVLSNTITNDGGGINIAGATTLTLIGGRLENNRSSSGFGYGGGVLADGALTISGTNFISNSVTGPGGGVYASLGPALTNVRFERNHSGDQGGGLRTNGAVTANGATFISNTAVQGGGLHADGAINLTGGLFEYNNAVTAGGGLYTNGTLILSGTQFLTNTATGSAGGLFAARAITLTNAQFISNTANGAGGVGSTGVIIINNSYFERNTAKIGFGGGVATTSTLIINGSTFVTNSASIWGGAAFSIGPAQLNGGLYQANQAISDPDAQGGALYISNTVSISGSRFMSNRAHAEGGALYAALAATAVNAQFISNTSQIAGAGGVYAGASLILTNSQFLSNTASYEGGGAAARDTATLSGGLFQNNQTGNSGGGLHAYGSAILSGTRFISNTASNAGGGAYVALTATVVNGAWIGNHADGFFAKGGALYAGTLFMTGTQLINNQTGNGYGGGLYAAGQAALTGGSVEQNYAFYGGGGLYAQAAVSISGTQILSNTGLYGGGGVLGDSVGLTNSRVENNVASQDRGGGVFAHDALIVNTQFISNSALSAGGGLYATGAMDSSQLISINIIDSVFERNSLSDLLNSQGGGLYALDAASISGTQFLTNSAGASGGALYAENNIQISKTLIISNSANLGGGVYLYCGQGTIVNSLFARNTASTAGINPGQGAALSLNDCTNSSVFDIAGNVQVVHTTIADTGLNPRQAIAIFSGTLNVTDTIIVNHAVAISTTSASANEDYNLYFGNGTKFLGSVSSGGHTVGSDPRFANASADDYHLALNSPAIDAGINAGVLDDFEGDARPQLNGFDIGFDEVMLRRIYLPLMLKNG